MSSKRARKAAKRAKRQIKEQTRHNKQHARTTHTREYQKAAMAAFERGETVYGVMDTKTGYWLGKEKKPPSLFFDLKLAQVSARVADVQAGWPAGRSRAKRFTGATRIVDEIPVVVDGLTAIKRLESGEVL